MIVDANNLTEEDTIILAQLAVAGFQLGYLKLDYHRPPDTEGLQRITLKVNIWGVWVPLVSSDIIDGLESLDLRDQ